VEETFIPEFTMPRRQVSAQSALAFDLKADRKKHKISQVKAAEILCVTQPTVARWEKSGGMPHIYRVVWNLHWKSLELINVDPIHPRNAVASKESTSESKEHSDVKSASARSRRNRHTNVIELRPREALGGRKVDGDAISSRSTSNSKRIARRKSSDSISAEDNGLRVIDEETSSDHE
jgi:transcriptional regulator with XRE-family HTH domain